MFKKLIALMMVMSIFTVSAQASTQNGLKAAFDELNYSINVEWDQKNQDFYKEQVKGFTATIKELQAQGLTNEQLITFVKTEVKNEKVAKDMETAFNMISINKMSSSEASKYMIETMERSYSNGASWNGAGSLLLGLGILFIVAAAAVGGGVYYTGSSSYCGYSSYYCGETCYSYPYFYCDPNYCCY